MNRFQMLKHAYQIAHENEIKVQIVPTLTLRFGTTGRSRPDLKLIQLVAPVWSETTYATFLHEAGHILSSNQLDPRTSNLLALAGIDRRFQQQNEIDAWRWATEHAIGWTPAMSEFALRALSTYGVL